MRGRSTVRLIALFAVLITMVQINEPGFAAEPRLRLRPNDGPPGTTVEALGRGFVPQSAGRLLWGDELHVADFTSDSDGEFTISFAVPDVAAGTHVVSAIAADQVTTDEFDVTTSDTNTAPSTSSTILIPATPAPASCPDAASRIVNVATSDELQKALTDAQPGDLILLADGAYPGRFIVDSPGAESERITICGTRAAILDGGGIKSGYGLHMTADYWTIQGISISNAQKGVVLDGANFVVLQGIEVHTIGDEAVHFRSFSSDNVIQDSAIHDTGLRREKFGEGIYLGSAVSNWGKYTDGEPDRSDRNQVLRNQIWNTTAEAIDIKEGTTGGLVQGNWFDGSLLSGADSWVDVKGNDYLISGNTGVKSPVDGFQTHVIDNMEWGSDNVFEGNAADVIGTGYGFYIHEPENSRNTVRCDNQVTAADKGMANVLCT